MVGRKGEANFVYEVVISLLLLAMFAYVVWMYIGTHATGEAFFSKFYAADMASTADVVNAGYGDVVLRYDNLKSNMDLTFWLKAGRVAVGKSNPQNVEPLDASVQFYGQPQQYGQPTIINNPVFLVLRKSNGMFAITEAETALKACPTVQEKAVKKENALVYLDVTQSQASDDGAQIRKVMADNLAPNGIVMTDDKSKANILITLSKQNGNIDSVDIAPTSADGQSFACLFRTQLKTISLTDFAGKDPSLIGKEFKVDIAITQNKKLGNDQIGEALATALVVYYR